MTRRIQLKLRMWLGLSLTTFLLLILLHLILPALLLILQVPSFVLGHQGWILRWQNETTGSGIRFSLTFLLIVAVVIGLILVMVKTKRYTI
jgi:hypothetical protein